MPNTSLQLGQKSSNSPPKYALCNGDNSDNNKECHIHKDLQKLRHPNKTKNETLLMTSKTNQNFHTPTSIPTTISPTIQ